MKDDTLTQIVLNVSFYDESGWVCIKAKSSERLEGQQFILNSGYEITAHDIRRFCRKHKLKLKYQYKHNSKHGVTLRQTYRLYREYNIFMSGKI